MNRNAYHRAYYARTRARRQKRVQMRYWCAWLIRELSAEAFTDRWVSHEDLRSVL